VRDAMMKKILLVLSNARSSSKAVEYAVDLAMKEGAKLIVLFVIEKEVVKEVFDTFSDIGFIGDKPSTKLTQAMMREFRQRGYEELQRIEDLAKEHNVAVEPIIEEGDFLEKALWIIDKYRVDSAVAIKKKRSAIASYFIKSQVLKLKELAPCTMDIFEEE
jgi:nucleotide-binding universal stress UspA family protein